MADEYQRGTDKQWLEHSNEELARLVKKRERIIEVLKVCLILTLIVLGWVIFKFTRHAPIQELWSFQMK
ncbi:MAG TPA: hypothetical protein VGH19_19740 [Verrucomicrobiae bacterium]